MPSATFTDARFRLDYSVSTVRQEIDNNRTLVRRVLVVVKTGSSYAHSSNTSTWSVTDRVGGSTVRSWSGTFTYNFGSYSSLTLMDRQDWITHNSDGTYSFESTADVRADTPLGNASFPWLPFTLATIPRATTPNITGGGGFTTGAATTINLPRASSSFTHDVSWSLGTKSGTIATAAATTASWNPPHTVMTELPNAASGTVEITVVTKNGSTVIGTKKVNFTLTAGAAVVPSVSGVAWSDNNHTVATNIGAFVQGVSLVKGTVSATEVHGSAITSKRILIGGQAFAEGTAFLVNGSGTITAQGEATDSRGRTATANSSLSVLPYTPPQIGTNGWQVRRANSSNVPDDNGQYLRIDLHAVAASLKPASTEKNALTITVRTKASDSGWVNRNTINPGLTHNTAFQVTGGAAFLTTKSYEVEITIVDKTGVPAVVLKTTVGTAVVSLDLNGNKVGVGKMHEFGALDVAGDIYASGKYYSGGVDLSTAGSITSGTFAADRIPAATETARGSVERATQDEVNTGTDTTRYVSPFTFLNSDIIKMPAPITVNYNGGNGNVGGVGGVFEHTTNMPYLSFTTPRPLYVSVDFGAASTYAYNGYIMFGVATTGAFVSNPYHYLGSPALGSAVYGLHTPFLLNTAQRPEVALTGVKKMLLPAGTTQFDLQRLRSTTGIVAVSAYSSITVSPISWA